MIVVASKPKVKICVCAVNRTVILWRIFRSVNGNRFIFAVGNNKKIYGVRAVGWSNGVFSLAAANGICIVTRNRFYRAAANLDIRTFATMAATNTCAIIIITCCGNSAATYGDICAFTIDATADACTIAAACCGNSAAADCDIRTIATFAATNTCASVAACCGKRTCAVIAARDFKVIVSTVALLQTRAFFTAL